MVSRAEAPEAVAMREAVATMEGSKAAGWMGEVAMRAEVGRGAVGRGAVTKAGVKAAEAKVVAAVEAAMAEGGRGMVVEEWGLGVAAMAVDRIANRNVGCDR